MPKCIKGLSTRRPPEPTADHDPIDAWMRSLMPDLQPIVRHLDATIRETIPGVHYAIKWKKGFYGTPELGWVIELVAYDVSVNAVFHGGADFADPPPLGDTDRSRYVKIASLDAAERPEIRRWIEQAGGVRGWT